MSRTVDIHRLAIREAKKAYRWYLARSPQAAMRFMAELDATVAKIVVDPARYPQYLAGTQNGRLRRFPYSVVFRTQGQVITIIAVAHGKRRPGYWKSRT